MGLEGFDGEGALWPAGCLDVTREFSNEQRITSMPSERMTGTQVLMDAPP